MEDELNCCTSAQIWNSTAKLIQPQQASQLETELGTAQPHLVWMFSQFSEISPSWSSEQIYFLCVGAFCCSLCNRPSHDFKKFQMIYTTMLFLKSFSWRLRRHQSFDFLKLLSCAKIGLRIQRKFQKIKRKSNHFSVFRVKTLK